MASNNDAVALEDMEKIDYILRGDAGWRGIGKYIMVRVTGAFEVLDGEGENPSLEFLQKSVDGWIEHLSTPSLPPGVCAFCNEEGKLLAMRQNELANRLISGQDDFIVGNVVIVGEDYESGESRWLTDEEVEKVKEVLHD